MSEISKYKEECMRRFKETQKYQKYDKEDLIDELYEKDNLLQQKENIIKEVREFAKLRKEMYERQENVVGQEVIISLLNLLDKGE